MQHGRPSTQTTDKHRDLATELRVSMNEDAQRAQKQRWTGPSAQTTDLEAMLRLQWATSRGVVVAEGNRDWRRLFGKNSGPIGANLPNDDHVTMWRKPTDRGRKISIWVSQPYPLGFDGLREMVDFANRHGLQFKVSTWPAWHYPGSVLFVEWTVHDPEAT